VVRGPQVVLGFCPCDPRRLNISPKTTEKIKLTWIAYHTLVENPKQFVFKGDNSRVLRRTFWLIKVVPTWKKFGKRWNRSFKRSYPWRVTSESYCRLGVKWFRSPYSPDFGAYPRISGDVFCGKRSYILVRSATTAEGCWYDRLVESTSPVAVLCRQVSCDTARQQEMANDVGQLKKGSVWWWINGIVFSH
jgi:hypothetical protein